MELLKRRLRTNVRPFESMTGSELVIAAYDESKDYDYRILAQEEIYRRYILNNNWEASNDQICRD